MEIITSQKGFPKLCLEGHMYTIQHKLKDSLRWRCSKAKVYSCPAILTTNKDMNQHQFVKYHNHEAKETDELCAKLRNHLKAETRSTNKSTNDVLATVFQNIDRTHFPSLPTEQSCKRFIRREKAKARREEPNNLEDSEVTGMSSKRNEDEETVEEEEVYVRNKYVSESEDYSDSEDTSDTEYSLKCKDILEQIEAQLKKKYQLKNKDRVMTPHPFPSSRKK